MNKGFVEKRKNKMHCHTIVFLRATPVFLRATPFLLRVPPCLMVFRNQKSETTEFTELFTESHGV
jgi:uncharacterized C2H2 Zn-finger protein